MANYNAYPDALKVSLVKRYLNGEEKKKLCSEYKIAKSTFWGWICKYQGLILKDWEYKEPSKSSDDELFVDIRPKCEEAIKSSIIKAADDTVRIFVNGFAIVCNAKSLKFVMELINHD